MIDFDLIIRNGTIVDGSGSPPFLGDVGVKGDWIAAVGQVCGRGTREIEARGCYVTPGFVDIHTHYDGQVVWSSRLTPSSDHGVTTVVTGNCGVGFAPCRPDDRDELISLMEGVEDIPGAVTAEGLTWEWESFPEFLDHVASREHDVDIAMMLPHSPLRVYVMGERGIRREPATAEDIVQMQDLTREAMAAGAIGVGTSRLLQHRTSKGEMIPTFDAAEAELQAIAEVLRELDSGVFQLVPCLTNGFDAEFEVIRRIAEHSKRPVTFSYTPMPGHHWREAAKVLDAANNGSVSVKAQLFPRPIGLVIGLEATVNPFCMSASWKEIAELPIADKVARMRDPELRRRLMSEAPENPKNPNFLLSRNFRAIFELGEYPNYEPDRSESILERAHQAGMDPLEFVYDLLLKNDGSTLLLCAMGNYNEFNLDFVYELLADENIIVGQGDGGAHYGMICDASYPTHMLTHWVRDRRGKRLSMEQAIHYLARKPAAVVGLEDRGLLKPGYRAHINVIDLERLCLSAPQLRFDLPAGGRRLHQSANGYVATVVNGDVVAEEGLRTGKLPGRLLRGAQQPQTIDGAAKMPALG